MTVMYCTSVPSNLSGNAMTGGIQVYCQRCRQMGLDSGLVTSTHGDVNTFILAVII